LVLAGRKTDDPKVVWLRDIVERARLPATQALARSIGRSIGKRR
jgi:hypothetical protein